MVFNFSKKWLEGFHYRIGLPLLPFVATTLLVVLIGFITILNNYHDRNLFYEYPRPTNYKELS